MRASVGRVEIEHYRSSDAQEAAQYVKMNDVVAVMPRSMM